MPGNVRDQAVVACPAGVPDGIQIRDVEFIQPKHIAESPDYRFGIGSIAENAFDRPVFFPLAPDCMHGPAIQKINYRNQSHDRSLYSSGL